VSSGEANVQDKPVDQEQEKVQQDKINVESSNVVEGEKSQTEK